MKTIAAILASLVVAIASVALFDSTESVVIRRETDGSCTHEIMRGTEWIENRTFDCFGRLTSRLYRDNYDSLLVIHYDPSTGAETRRVRL